MKYLNEYKNLSYIQSGLIVTCLGLFIAGVTQIEDDGFGISSTAKGLIIGASVIGNLTWIPYFIKPEKIEKAIKAYNE